MLDAHLLAADTGRAMSQENVEVVRRGIASADTFWALLDEHVVFDTRNYPCLDIFGTPVVVGRKAVLAHESAGKIVAPHSTHSPNRILPCEIERHVGTPVGTHCLPCQTATSPASLPERAPSVVTNPIEGISGPAPFPLDARPLLF